MDKLRHWVASTEDVGPAFAEEARRIHNQDAPERAIGGVRRYWELDPSPRESAA